MLAGNRRNVVEERLTVLASQESLDELGSYLLAMTNSGFRAASTLLAEKVLPKFKGESFWRVFSYLSLLNPKAFLGTCLKAATSAYVAGEVRLEGENLESYSAHLVSHEMNIDRDKFLRASLLLLKEEAEVLRMWKMFAVDSPQKRIEYLVHCNTIVSYHQIFKECKRIQDNHDFLRKLCYALIKKGDTLSFNLASIVRSYFDVNDVGALFSLNLEPYKLSYLDKSFDNFKKVITSL